MNIFYRKSQKKGKGRENEEYQSLLCCKKCSKGAEEMIKQKVGKKDFYKHHEKQDNVLEGGKEY